MKWALLAGNEDQTWTERLAESLGDLSSRKLKVVGLEAWAGGGNGIVIPLETAAVASYWDWPFAEKFGKKIAVIFPSEMGQVEGEGGTLQWLVTHDGLKLSWTGDPGFLVKILGLPVETGERELDRQTLPRGLYWFTPSWEQRPDTTRAKPPANRTMTEFWEEQPGPKAAGAESPPAAGEVDASTAGDPPEVAEEPPAPEVDGAPPSIEKLSLKAAEVAPPSGEEQPAVGTERGTAGAEANSTGDLGDLDDLTLESAEIPKPAPIPMPAPVPTTETSGTAPPSTGVSAGPPQHFGVGDAGAKAPALPTQISCLHPHICKPDTPFLLDVVLHLPEAAPSPSRPGEKVERALGSAQLPAGAQLRVEVRPPPGFSVDSPHSALSWLPPSSRVGFMLTAEKDIREGSHIIPVLLYPSDGSVVFCRVYATVEVGTEGAVVTETGNRPTARIPTKIFASYASKDRAEVLERVASLEALGIDVFVDCLDIAEGHRWEEGIQQQICSRDALLLFWSRAAAASRWVEQEWKLALAERGLDYIFPNALEAPTLCPPPPPLAALQFGSTLLATPWSAPLAEGSPAPTPAPAPSAAPGPNGAATPPPAAVPPSDSTSTSVTKQRRWWLLIGGILAAIVLCTGGLGLVAALAGWWDWGG